MTALEFFGKALSWTITLILIVAIASMMGSVFQKKTSAKEVACVGNCPKPGPMDCTIYGRKKDGSWPSGYECSSTP